MPQLPSAAQTRQACSAFGNRLRKLFGVRSKDVHLPPPRKRTWANVAVSIHQDLNLLRIKIHMPGIDAESIQVELNGQFLSLSCRTHTGAQDQPGQPLRRTLPLPCRVCRPPVKIDCQPDFIELVLEKYVASPGISLKASAGRSATSSNIAPGKLLH